MTATSEATAEVVEREIRLTRVFNAPRDLVYQAWTDPQHLPQWWGPKGFTTTVHEIDVRPGGVWRFVMHGPDGVDYPNKITFLEIEKPERLVYRHGGEKEFEPVNFQTTVTFREEDGRTHLTMQMQFPSNAARDFVIDTYGAVEGGKQHLDCLENYVTKMSEENTPTGTEAESREFVISREFNAPRDLVFRAWTESERLMHWWGPKGFTLHSCTNDLRPDGVFLYGMRMPDGGEMWGKWVYRDIVAPERLVFVASFADEAGNTIRAPFSDQWPLEVLSTVTFTEHEGRTTLTMRGVPLNATEAEAQAFEGMNASMQNGWTGTLDQLDEYLASA